MLLAILSICSEEELDVSDDDEEESEARTRHLAEAAMTEREYEMRKQQIKNKILAVGRMQRVFQLLRYVLATFLAFYFRGWFFVSSRLEGFGMLMVFSLLIERKRKLYQNSTIRLVSLERSPRRRCQCRIIILRGAFRLSTRRTFPFPYPYFTHLTYIFSVVVVQI